MSDIKPALTSDEWAKAVRREPFPVNPKNYHAVAALCLHDQPFGFDNFRAIGYEPGEGDIVTALRDVADAIDTATGPKMIGCVDVVGPCGRAAISASYAELFRCVADRIAALLPPPTP